MVTYVLVYPTLGEKSLEYLCYSRIDWALLLCHSDLALNEFEEEQKVTYEPQDKNDMRA